MKIKVMNTGENPPEYFYVFIGNGRNSACQSNWWNYNLSHKMHSAGFNSIIFQPELINDYIAGNIDYFPFVPNKTSLNCPSSHTLSVINGYNVEYALERYRRINCTTYPSRFSCLYAFGDYASCELASKLYKWDINNVKKFRLHDFSLDNKESAFLNNAVKVCKCNMEIVTFMWKNDLFRFPLPEGDKLCSQYWESKGAVACETQNIESGNWEIRNCEVLYEYLIEGILEEVFD